MVDHTFPRDAALPAEPEGAALEVAPDWGLLEPGEDFPVQGVLQPLSGRH